MYREFLRFTLQTCINPSRSGFFSVLLITRSGKRAYFNFANQEQAIEAFKRILKKEHYTISGAYEALKRLCGDDVDAYGFGGSGSQRGSSSSNSTSS